MCALLRTAVEFGGVWVLGSFFLRGIGSWEGDFGEFSEFGSAHP